MLTKFAISRTHSIIISICLTSVFFFSLLHTNAQSKRANVWYVSEGIGYDFNCNPPCTNQLGGLGDAKSSATICDKNGALQFYTDNETIWNWKHQVMANGTGLYSCRWAQQGSVIVPLSTNPFQYYLITCDDLRYPVIANAQFICSDINPVSYILSLNLIDMSANNFNGQVLIKNKVIYGSGHVMSTIAAVKHANTKDTWIMTYDFKINRFVSLLLTDCGIQETVISPDLGIVVFLEKNTITFSPKGDLFHIRTGYMLPESGSMIAHFDNSTGLAYNPIFFRGDNTQSCFSVDNTYLYQAGGEIRYNISDLSDTAAIYASREKFDFGYGANFGVQNGPDGKVYFATNKPYYVTMNSVDQPSSAKTTYSTQLSTHITKPIQYAQLVAIAPNFVQSWFDPNFKEYEYGSPVIQYTRTCITSSARFIATGIPPATHYHWEIEEVGEAVKKYFDTDTITHAFAHSGKHRAKLIIDFSCKPDIITRNDIFVDDFPKKDFIKDVDVCIGDNYVLNAEPNQVQYLWNTGNTNPHQIGIAGNTYAVQVSNTCGQNTDSVYLKRINYKLPNLITPNNDSHNDTFEVESDETFEGNLEIYNSWGSMIYQNSKYKNTWPEQEIDEGVYYYRFSYSTCGPVNSWLQVIK